ncbi:GRIP and coiled-coil domain-containing protein 2-like isoform X10 [Pongo pygmaeus]|uniref:GRIP and coiled-coil domain-containing protein 2-like isoform X10 n=1 Tax=Pongo pygmaeus TaxID=9600 RepID=UPI00300CC096
MEQSSDSKVKNLFVSFPTEESSINYTFKTPEKEYEKQSEQLNVEKELADNFERHIEDLTRQLRNSTLQCEKINSDNEDLLARIETLQSNAKLLEVQILEVQRAKAMIDKELEAEKLQKEQKIKEHATTVNELEELQVQLQKEKKQLQKTMQELELVKKDAQQTTLMNMEIADYERLMKELNQKLTNKNNKIEDLEQEIKIQKQKQETLQEEITSLQSSVQQYEEKNTKIKQLLVKAKKELADSKQAAEQATITSEFESYKVRVHNVLKQQKNKSVSQAETEGAKQEREHLEMLIDQLKMKLQDSQNNLQINVSELQTLQSEHDTLLERHKKMLQEAVSKEAELRENVHNLMSSFHSFLILMNAGTKMVLSHSAFRKRAETQLLLTISTGILLKSDFIPKDL